ncbi:MAG: GNAT family N-acetyltransferase [Pseudomonadota bacterium]
MKRIRTAVFIIEQNVPEAEEWDGLDEVSTHFLALAEKRDTVGTARLEPTGKIGRIAVMESYRGCGIGSLLLRAAVREARRQRLDPIYMHAQTHAGAFYERHGFRRYGQPFLEAGIEHVKMRLERN